MSDTPLQRVQPGDPLKFPAATFNIFCDTAEAVARMRGQFAAGVPQGRDLNTGVVTVRNDSGYDRERFDVLGLGAPIIDNSENLAEFKNRVTFKGETPSLASHVGRFAILLEPIAAGKLGKAVVSGVTVARIDVANTYHGFAEIIGGECGKLRSGPCGGAQILWKETGTGLLWGIVRVGTPTLTCRFELKQNLVPGGYAQAYLLDYAGVYQIDPAVEITVYDTLSIRRGRARNYPYYAGSAGYARFWHDSGRWEIVEMHPMAMILQGQVDQSSGVEPGDSTFAVDGVTLMQPIGGLLDAMPSTVRNRFSQKLKDDDRVLILWNETDTAWDAFSPGTKASGIQWAKVYGTFTNASGATSHTVTCQKCMWDGTGVGDQLDLKTPLRANMDTALFDGYVVGYQEEPDQSRVIVTDIWDAPIGSVRAWDSSEAIRDGWEELTAAAGRFLVGCESGETWDDPGDTGGTDLNDLATHSHDAHPETEENCLTLGTEFKIYMSLTHSEEDVSPPWYAVKHIKRTS